MGGLIVEAEKYDSESPIAPFVIMSSADGRQYITATAGYFTAPTTASNTDQAWYSVKATAAEMTFYVTANLATDDSDSFFFQVAPLSAWETKNGTRTFGFQEVLLATVSGATVGQTYTLKIQRREAGAQLDKFRVEGGTFINGWPTVNSPDLEFPELNRGAALFGQLCGSCHNYGFEGRAGLAPNTRTQAQLASFIEAHIPHDKPNLCVGQCAQDVANYIRNDFMTRRLGPPGGPFKCTEVIGLYTTGEWFDAGFEAALGAPLADTWEGRFAHYGYMMEYAKPDSYAWSPTSVSGVNSTRLTTPCIAAGNQPDRIVYQAWTWELTSEAAWITHLEAALATIQAKRPSAKRIDVMTIIRCPQNGYCHADQPQFGIGADKDANRQDCHVPEFVDSAIAKVAANHFELVSVAPKFEAKTCNPGGIDGIHLGDANKPVAQEIAAYYKSGCPEGYYYSAAGCMTRRGCFYPRLELHTTGGIPGSLTSSSCTDTCLDSIFLSPGGCSINFP